MQLDWRALYGPALTAATALIAIVVDRHFIAVPNPAPLFVCIVAFAASLSGLASGMSTAAIAVAGSALFFFNHRITPGYDTADLVPLLMLALTAAGTAAITGLLRKRWMDAFAWERTHHATAERLSAALDQVDIGIVLLDADTRAEFINRAFRDYFKLSDAQADSKPPFIARSEEHTSELQSQSNLVCRLLLEKKNDHNPRPDALETGLHKLHLADVDAHRRVELECASSVLLLRCAEHDADLLALLDPNDHLSA